MSWRGRWRRSHTCRQGHVHVRPRAHCMLQGLACGGISKGLGRTERTGVPGGAVVPQLMARLLERPGCIRPPCRCVSQHQPAGCFAACPPLVPPPLQSLPPADAFAPGLQVADWWLQHLRLDGGAPAPDELRVLRWAYGSVVYVAAEDFAARQRELRNGRDRDAAILELYDEVAAVWRNLQVRGWTPYSNPQSLHTPVMCVAAGQRAPGSVGHSCSSCACACACACTAQVASIRSRAQRTRPQRPATCAPTP